MDSSCAIYDQVAGYAVGGGHVLHMVCDMTIAADNAIFGQTGPKVISGLKSKLVSSCLCSLYTWILNCDICNRFNKCEILQISILTVCCRISYYWN